MSTCGGKKVHYSMIFSNQILAKIAKRHGTTVDKLCKLNGIKANKTLKVGQRIRVK